MINTSSNKSLKNKNIEAIYPLSPMQEGMLFHSLYAPNSGVYCVQLSITLSGHLQPNDFRKAWQKVVNRHTILRTFFIWEKRQQPLQVVRQTVELPWIEYDWRSFSSQEQDNQLETLLKQDRKQGFDLKKAPLMRCILIQLSDQTYQFIWSYHHILKDGWCSSIIAQEVWEFYQGFTENKTVSLATPTPYQNYINWLQKQDFKQAETFWRNNLKGVINPISLPIKNVVNQPNHQKNTYYHQVGTLTTQLTDKLQQLCRDNRLTLNAVFQGIWALLLSRYSGESDVMFGGTVSGRPPELPGIESMVGLFINTLPIRIIIDDKTPVLSWFKELQSQQLERETYSYSSLINIQGWTDIPRHLSLFESILIFENYPIKNSVFEEQGKVNIIQSKGFETSHYPLTITIMPEENLFIEISYNSRQFSDSLIRQILQHFIHLLEQVTNNIFQPIRHLSLLTASEKEELIVDWNQTQFDYPKTKCLHQLFEEQVNKNPDAIAIKFEEKSLTYNQLNEKANQLASYLKKLGVKLNDLVAISVERSLEMVIGLLGILKVGGTYIPIDPTYPSERINYILDHSQVEVILTQSWVWEGKRKKDTVIYIDTLSHFSYSPHALHSPTSPEDLAYIIYTSGSTGKPKGVEISHQAIVNFLCSMAQQPGINSHDVLLSVTTLSFDIAGLELFLPLITGATVVLVSRETAIDGVALSEKIDQCNASIMQATPATWQMLIDAGWKGKKDLKILCGGEALSPTLAKELLSKSGELWNMYGPTETTVWSMIEKIETEEKITIGCPIHNTQIYILDKQLQPIPVGVPGELYIGGDGLAKGYVNRPDLTQERFINNPFNPGKKIYKTGDLARYLPNGKVEYLGRSDYQVKIRGFRIELGEIESQLNQYSGVKHSVVVAKKEASGMSYLVAYYIAKKEKDITLEGLRDFLRQKLPNYMVPSTFIPLDEFPLTPNGKIDRKALPEPNKTILDNQYVAPRTPIEKELVAIWQDILGGTFGIHDDFFSLGGHSLLATQVISRIKQQLSVEIPLRSLFESPTIAQLSAIIDKGFKTTHVTQKPTIKRVSREQKLPLSFAQQRLWFLDQLDPDNHTYNISGAIQLQGDLNEEVLEKSLNEIVRRHEILRTSFQTDKGQPIQVIASQLHIPIIKQELQSVSVEEKERVIKQIAIREAETPFNLQQGPLLRIKLLALGDDEFILMFTLHHIIFDVWSSGVIINELSTLYNAFSQNKPSPLPDLSIQYADFAYWQHQWLKGDVLQQELNYWQQKLADLPLLNLEKIESKLNYSSSQNLSKSSQSFTLSKSLSQQLNDLSQQNGVTLFMTILAALSTLLYRHTEQDDIIIGTDVANRNQGQIEGLIGFFINILLLRMDLSGHPSFQDLLLRVREITLDAYTHQDLPFGKLVETLQPERSLNQTPLFQVLLVFQNAPVPPLELPGLTLKPVELYEGKAKFDLVLFIEETEEGITGNWKHKPGKLNPDTLYQLSKRFQTLLQNIVNHPDLKIEELEMQTEAEKQQKIKEQSQREKAKFNKFKRVKTLKPKAVSLSQQQLIKTEQFQAEQPLPLIIKPNLQEIDIIDWAKNNRSYLEEKLQQHGAILFRGFNFNQVSEFETLAQAICPNLFGNYGDLPREGISNKVYGSTPYPADKPILFHNESSHLNSWPQKIWFFCVQPAEKGGETPIIDCREVYQKLDKDIREILKKKQFMYVRNYIKDFDVSWQDFFKTDDKKAVETYCENNQIDWEWLPNDGLRTKKICPAIIEHPITKEFVFFNQIKLHHISFLDPDVSQSLLSNFGYEGLPRNVYYGDGSPIEDEIINHIQSIYQDLSVSFLWQKGDVLMLDNMLTAHSRNPYQGQRKIVVAMGNIISLNHS